MGVRPQFEKVPDCGCALDGVSGGVSTPRLGCLDHLKEAGMPDFFCMIVDGPGCENSNPSTAFPGATWRGCDGVSGGTEVSLRIGDLSCMACYLLVVQFSDEFAWVCSGGSSLWLFSRWDHRWDGYW